MNSKKQLAEGEVRQVGRRTVLRRPDEVDVAETKHWMLVEVTGWKREGWVNLKLFRTIKSRKNVFYIGVSESKFELGKSKDQKTLETNYPEIIPWVINSVKEYLIRK